MKKGFTLAEVLITLGIIGIVAALTIPQLIKNYEKKVLHTQFLKVYSDLNNAAKMFEAQESFTVHEYGVNSNRSSTDLLEKYMKYFNGKSKVASINRLVEGETGFKEAYKRLLGYIPAALNGSDTSPQPCDHSFLMSDVSGRFFVMDDMPTSELKNGPKICVDTNGKKGPNKYGYDWFVFTFTEKKGVIPYIGNNPVGNSNVDLDDPSTYCSYTQNYATYTCAYYALSDTSPLDKSKSYWSDFLK